MADIVQNQGITAQGPPYPPSNQGLGQNPAVVPDVPISAVFLVLYLIFGVIHIKILRANNDRGHKFIFNGLILGMYFLLARQKCTVADDIQVYARFDSAQWPFE
jgi:hypothetical protein